MNPTLEVLPPTEATPPMKQVAIWEPFEAKLAKLQIAALTLKVTDVSQVSEMKLARVTRLALREVRIAIEHRRKELGEEHLRETQRINAGAKELKDLIEPLEARLLEQEEFIEREAAKQRAELSRKRTVEVAPYADASLYNLAEMPEDVYQEALASLKHSAEQKRIAAEQAEAARVDREKEEAEERERIRQENERLRKEVAEREKVARQEADAAAAERRKLQKLVEAEREKAAEQARLAAEKARNEREAAEAALQKERDARKRMELQQSAAKAKAVKDGPWKTSEAPKDRPIVAIGGIMAHDEFSVTKIPFCDAIEWNKAEGDWFLYHRVEDGPKMCLRRAMDDMVVIHFWLDYPELTQPATTEGSSNGN